MDPSLFRTDTPIISVFNTAHLERIITKGDILGYLEEPLEFFDVVLNIADAATTYEHAKKIAAFVRARMDAEDTAEASAKAAAAKGADPLADPDSNQDTCTKVAAAKSEQPVTDAVASKEEDSWGPKVSEVPDHTTYNSMKM
jgi:hypothetical protein